MKTSIVDTIDVFIFSLQLVQYDLKFKYQICF